MSQITSRKKRLISKNTGLTSIQVCEDVGVTNINICDIFFMLFPEEPCNKDGY